MTIKKIDSKHNFLNLLFSDRQQALSMLKNEDGEFLEVIQIGGKKFKIFSSGTLTQSNLDELFSEKNQTLLPPGYSAFFVCDVVYKKLEVTRSNFTFWCFAGNVDFSGTKFLNKANFNFSVFTSRVHMNSTIFSKNTDFWGVLFTGDMIFDRTIFLGKTYFGDSKFSGYPFFGRAVFNGNVSFENVIFSNYLIFARAVFRSEATFKGTVFVGGVSFIKACFERSLNMRNVKFEGKVNFNDVVLKKHFFLSDSVFAERCDLRVKEFGSSADFRGVEFRASLFINGWQSFCYMKKLRYFPGKIRTPKVAVYDSEGKYDIPKSKDNLHAVKQMFNKVADYDGEDHFYYWYKVAERRCREKPYRFRPLEWVLLDKLTGYLTKPWRVFATMLGVIFLFFWIFFYANVATSSLGTLVVHEASRSGEHIKRVTLLEHTKGVNTCFCRDILYFNMVTFTTLGYGDIQPTGWLKLVAASEGLVGVLLMSTFLVTLTKKVLW